MSHYPLKPLITLILISVFLWSEPSIASNRYYADNTLEPTNGFAWDWSAGAGYYVEDSFLVGMDSYNDGLELDLNLALSYNNFYLDIDHSQLSGGIIVGYSVVEEFDWELDIIGTNVQDGFDETGLDFYHSGTIDELAGIRSRHYDFNAGIRVAKRFNNAQISFEYLQDISNAHNGWIINTFFSHILPWRNWEFRTGIGITAYSADFTNYYFGIDASETTPTRALYNSGPSANLVFELHAEYPLNQHWVFLGGWLSTWFSDEITHSPIVSQSYQHKAMVGVRYVF